MKLILTSKEFYALLKPATDAALPASATLEIAEVIVPHRYGYGDVTIEFREIGPEVTEAPAAEVPVVAADLGIDA